jgi:hypothetical protein|uniref:hypothetical protein n=1 Tax=Faecalibacterium prausnitzii TaxID=853 RepID=UPI000A9B3CCB
MDVSVNSTIIQVSSRKKGNPLLCWQSPIDGKDDLLDLLISRIQDPTLFQFTKQRFGDGTAASPETSSAISIEKNENSRVPKKFDKKVLELVPFDVAPYKNLPIFTEIVKENGIELYRYAFFTVLYGEGGDRADVRREEGDDVKVGPNDAICRRFHVFIAYIRDPQNTTAVMLTEARGRNGIADPMRWQVKKLLGTIDKNKYSVLAQEFIDDEALQTFIDSNPWGEIQLIKGKDTSERGDLLEYTKQTLMMTLKLAPQKDGKRGTIAQAIRDKFFLGQPINGIEEIDDFKPDKIKFSVKSNTSERFFTVDKPLSGGIRRVLDQSILMVDGLSNDVRILNEFKRIFVEDHLSQ